MLNCEGINPFSDNSESCSSQVYVPDVGYEEIFFDLSLNNQLSDKNNYFHIEWLEGYIQTFATIQLQTNVQGYNLISWNSDTDYCVDFLGSLECVNVVNPQSYSSDGTAYQIMGVWEEMVGDTITIYSNFIDWCQIQYIDSLKIVVDNNI